MQKGKIYIIALSVARYENHAEYFRNQGFEVRLTTSLDELNNFALVKGDVVLLEPVMGKPMQDLPGLILKDMPMISLAMYRNTVAWGIYYWLIFLKKENGIRTWFLVSEGEQELMRRLSYYKQMMFFTAPGNGPREMLNCIMGATSLM